MRSFLVVLSFVALTFFCWGVYGPVLHEGQAGLGSPPQTSSLRPFICVGLAYFLIAVIVPVTLLRTTGEKGAWTSGGLAWSIAAGITTAIGALGIILAFKSRGSPVYVMPLVFGGAPVVNTLATMFMNRTLKRANAILIAGVVVVAVGAAGVLTFKPRAPKEVDHESVSITTNSDGSLDIEVERKLGSSGGGLQSWHVPSLQELSSNKEFSDAQKAYAKFKRGEPLTFLQMCGIGLSVALTVLCWGSYGPMLHKGQMKMAGSRMRPFLCVGLSYFAIAVIVPLLLLPALPEAGGWTFWGTTWSLIAGVAGAVGSLGIILAFNFGGKPIYVMPLVFGGAPVINTFVTVVTEGTVSFVTTPFYISLVLVIVGAVTVMVFAPKPSQKPAGAKREEPKEDAKQPKAEAKPQQEEAEAQP